MSRSKKDAVHGHRTNRPYMTSDKGWPSDGGPAFRRWAKRKMKRRHRAYGRITMSELLHEFEEQQREERHQQWLEYECLDHFEEDWSDYDEPMDIWDYDEPDDMSAFEYDDLYDPYYYDYGYDSDYTYDRRNNIPHYQVVDTTNNGVVTEGRSLADILIEIQKLQLS